MRVPRRLFSGRTGVTGKSCIDRLGVEVTGYKRTQTDYKVYKQLGHSSGLDVQEKRVSNGS